MLGEDGYYDRARIPRPRTVGVLVVVPRLGRTLILIPRMSECRGLSSVHDRVPESLPLDSDAGRIASANQRHFARESVLVHALHDFLCCVAKVVETVFSQLEIRYA